TLGGVIRGIETGYFQRELAESAYRYQMEIDHRERIVVGVNEYVADEPIEIPILEMDPEGYERQVARLNQVRAERDNAAVEKALRELEDAARGDENLMYPIIEAVKVYATLGEMMGVFRKVFGEYHEPVFF
ncbi:MAG TPA: methylmalonyl-CoA mutase, partial [Anaerolineae bacterium]|nr:methylmalonyl-CoA mutase [Anaerolineae bacterium]